ncbi:MAG: FAD:protein FMN transferase [Flavobacteriales bacterium]|nr:FAD:protein FMN transferase [Flavobacteriales bacterium]
MGSVVQDRSVWKGALLVLLVSACGHQVDPVDDLMTLQGEAQGTTFTIKYVDPEHRDLSDEVDSILRGIDRSLSLWDPSSTVSRFNESAQLVTSDPYFLEVLQLSRLAYAQTTGAFDPTMLPVLRAWGLGPRGEDELVLDSVAPRIERVDLDGILAEPPPGQDMSGEVTVTKRWPLMEFDPNGIAQGYTVDVLCEQLVRKGLTDILVEVGGEVRALGKNPTGSSWTIGIDKPLLDGRRELETQVPLEGRSLATSGNYRKYREVNGRRYGHTIDPWTGHPVEHGLLSVSVIASQCAMADAFATALLVMGPEKAVEWAMRRSDVEVFLIMDDGAGGYATWSTADWPGDADIKGVSLEGLLQIRSVP